MKQSDSFTDIVAGNARIENLMNNNGSATVGKRMLNRDYNGGKKRDKNGVEHEISADALVSPYAYKSIIRLDEKPVFIEQIRDLDPQVRSTKGFFLLKYLSKGNYDYLPGRPFRIGQDLMRWDVRVAGPNHFHALAKKIPELGWIERNTTISDKLFDIARRHPNMSFWFGVDWVAYEEKLQAQSKEEISSTFVAKKVSVDVYEKNKEDYDKKLEKRYFIDVLKEVNDCERLDIVKQEMLENSGEIYERSRKYNNQPRDPITGQFLKKDKKKERVR